MFFPKPSFPALNSGGIMQKNRGIAINNASTIKNEIIYSITIFFVSVPYFDSMVTI